MTSGDESVGLVRLALIVIAVLILLPVVIMVLAVPLMGTWMWGGHMMGDAGPVWGLVVMVGWVIVLGVIGYLVYRVLVGEVDTPATVDPAVEEVRVAYARGEIGEEEFERRRARLRDEDR